MIELENVIFNTFCCSHPRNFISKMEHLFPPMSIIKTHLTCRFLQSCTSARVVIAFTLKLSTSTFLSFLKMLTSVRSAPQQLSFFTWPMSDTLVRAMIISSDSFTIFKQLVTSLAQWECLSTYFHWIHMNNNRF